jgi:hypothetical protein
VALQQFMQIDFVGAAQDRGWIIDHRQPFLLGLARKLIGVMVDGGIGADEQRVEFRQAAIIFFW